MNADGSRDVSVDAQLAARLSGAWWFVAAFIALGALSVAGGGQLEDKTWFGSLLALGLLSAGLLAMFAYVVAGPDGTNKRVAARPSIAGAART